MRYMHNTRVHGYINSRDIHTVLRSILEITSPCLQDLDFLEDPMFQDPWCSFYPKTWRGLCTPISKIHFSGCRRFWKVEFWSTHFVAQLTFRFGFSLSIDQEMSEQAFDLMTPEEERRAVDATRRRLDGDIFSIGPMVRDQHPGLQIW